MKHIIRRSLNLSVILLKEQIKEPTALFWAILSPAAFYYLINYTKGLSLTSFNASYIESTSWFYAYISSFVALFGLSFYLIGRRESGFVRSFIYSNEAKLIFLSGQLLAYSCLSFLYCSIFYCLTKLPFGDLQIEELLVIGGRFYLSFLLFSIPGLLISLIPITFQSAGTLYSITSFTMLILAVFGGTNVVSSSSNIVYMLNPLYLGKSLISQGFSENITLIILTLLMTATFFYVTYRYFRINPIWSRY